MGAFFIPEKIMNETLKIALVRFLSPHWHNLDDTHLAGALRDKLAWKTVSFEQYQNLAWNLPKGMHVVIDHDAYSGNMAQPSTLDISVALERQDQLSRKKSVPAVGKNESVKKTSKVKKGLTPKQKAELERLRKELENVQVQ